MKNTTTTLALFTIALCTICLSPAAAQATLFSIETKITASDTAANDHFGYSVAISGNTALVGAYRNDDGGSNSGSAYLFDVSTGNQLAKLTASDAAAADHFGWSVAISGNTALVGAFTDDDAGSQSGSAYLFENTIPEPSSLLLSTLAIAGLLARRRK